MPPVVNAMLCSVDVVIYEKCYNVSSNSCPFWDENTESRFQNQALFTIVPNWVVYPESQTNNCGFGQPDELHTCRQNPRKENDPIIDPECKQRAAHIRHNEGAFPAAAMWGGRL